LDERRKLDLDENTFIIYAVIKRIDPSISHYHAREINAVFEKFPDYRCDECQERKLRAGLYRSVISLVGGSKMVEVTDSLMRLRKAEDPMSTDNWPI
jgi:type I restriction enzyme R subunit